MKLQLSPLAMRTTTTYRIAGLTLGLILGCTMAFAQGDKASRPSPPATASGKVGPATITIEYSSPAVKGRKIWGELRSEEHTSELQSRENLVCRLLLEKKKVKTRYDNHKTE